MLTIKSKYNTDLSIINDQIVKECDDNDGHAYCAEPTEGVWFFNPGQNCAYLFTDGEWEQINGLHFDRDDTATYDPAKEFDYSKECQFMDRLDNDEREAFGLDPIEVAQ